MLLRMPKFEVNYRGTRLCIDVEIGSAGLSINGLERDRKPLTPGQSISLSSTVQTDYEWHEFVEGILEIGEEQVKVTLTANSQVLIEEVLERT